MKKYTLDGAEITEKYIKCGIRGCIRHYLHNRFGTQHWTKADLVVKEDALSTTE